MGINPIGPTSPSGPLNPSDNSYISALIADVEGTYAGQFGNGSQLPANTIPSPTVPVQAQFAAWVVNELNSLASNPAMTSFSAIAEQFTTDLQTYVFALQGTGQEGQDLYTTFPGIQNLYDFQTIVGSIYSAAGMALPEYLQPGISTDPTSPLGSPLPTDLLYASLAQYYWIYGPELGWSSADQQLVTDMFKGASNYNDNVGADARYDPFTGGAASFYQYILNGVPASDLNGCSSTALGLYNLMSGQSFNYASIETFVDTATSSQGQTLANALQTEWMSAIGTSNIDDSNLQGWANAQYNSTYYGISQADLAQFEAVTGTTGVMPAPETPLQQMADAVNAWLATLNTNSPEYASQSAFGSALLKAITYAEGQNWSLSQFYTTLSDGTFNGSSAAAPNLGINFGSGQTYFTFPGLSYWSLAGPSGLFSELPQSLWQTGNTQYNEFPPNPAQDAEGMYAQAFEATWYWINDPANYIPLGDGYIPGSALPPPESFSTLATAADKKLANDLLKQLIPPGNGEGDFTALQTWANKFIAQEGGSFSQASTAAQETFCSITGTTMPPGSSTYALGATYTAIYNWQQAHASDAGDVSLAQAMLDQIITLEQTSATDNLTSFESYLTTTLFGAGTDVYFSNVGTTNSGITNLLKAAGVSSVVTAPVQTTYDNALIATYNWINGTTPPTGADLTLAQALYQQITGNPPPAGTMANLTTWANGLIGNTSSAFWNVSTQAQTEFCTITGTTIPDPGSSGYALGATYNAILAWQKAHANDAGDVSLAQSMLNQIITLEQKPATDTLTAFESYLNTNLFGAGTDVYFSNPGTSNTDITNLLQAVGISSVVTAPMQTTYDTALISTYDWINGTTPPTGVDLTLAQTLYQQMTSNPPPAGTMANLTTWANGLIANTSSPFWNASTQAQTEFCTITGATLPGPGSSGYALGATYNAILAWQKAHASDAGDVSLAQTMLNQITTLEQTPATDTLTTFESYLNTTLFGAGTDVYFSNLGTSNTDITNLLQAAGVSSVVTAPVQTTYDTALISTYDWINGTTPPTGADLTLAQTLYQQMTTNPPPAGTMANLTTWANGLIGNTSSAFWNASTEAQMEFCSITGTTLPGPGSSGYTLGATYNAILAWQQAHASDAGDVSLAQSMLDQITTLEQTPATDTLTTFESYLNTNLFGAGTDVYFSNPGTSNADITNLLQAAAVSTAVTAPAQTTYDTALISTYDWINGTPAPTGADLTLAQTLYQQMTLNPPPTGTMANLTIWANALVANTSSVFSSASTAAQTEFCTITGATPPVKPLSSSPSIGPAINSYYSNYTNFYTVLQQMNIPGFTNIFGNPPLLNFPVPSSAEWQQLVSNMRIRCSQKSDPTWQAALQFAQTFATPTQYNSGAALFGALAADAALPGETAQDLLTALQQLQLQYTGLSAQDLNEITTITAQLSAT